MLSAEKEFSTEILKNTKILPWKQIPFMCMRHCLYDRHVSRKHLVHSTYIVMHKPYYNAFDLY